MTRNEIKQALISICIGAIIAFLTTFLEGIIHILQNTENNIIGSVTGSLFYILKNARYFG